MHKIQAWKAEDGTIHETQESARNADSRLEYAGRIKEFIKDSPLVYEGARDLESWLLTDDGYGAVLRLAAKEGA
jgi:hypothetical protein